METQPVEYFKTRAVKNGAQKAPPLLFAQLDPESIRILGCEGRVRERPHSNKRDYAFYILLQINTVINIHVEFM